MGLTTTIIFHNDYLHEMEKDPKLGEKLAAAIQDAYSHKRIDNYAQIVSQSHSSETWLLAVGGNDGSVVGYQDNAPHHNPQARMELLKNIAEQFGYELVEKKTGKSDTPPDEMPKVFEAVRADGLSQSLARGLSDFAAGNGTVRKLEK